MWGETGGSEIPAARTFYSRFPPPSLGVPASLVYVDCKMLHNIAKFFSFSPGSRHFGNPASRPFSSRLPYPSRPYSPGLPAPVSFHFNDMCSEVPLISGSGDLLELSDES